MKPAGQERQGIVHGVHDASGEGPPGPARRRSMLPTLITTLAMFLGLLALSNAARGQWETACMLLLFAAIMDGVDGAAARLTRSASDFGAEYDSMADVISFGVIPAALIMLWTQSELGKLAVYTPTIYVICAAFRLARYNVHKGGKESYHGLPSPLAALFLSSFVWLVETTALGSLEYQVAIRTLTAAAAVLMGGLMVSRIPFPRLNSLRSLQGHTPLTVLLWAAMIAAIFTLIFINPPLSVFAFSSCYLAWGLVNGVLAWMVRRSRIQARRDRSAGERDAAA